ncbi:MAG TPA: hypothetical protein PKH07_07445 [bacterium]|nr:hypothetical protein [bacterium]
MASKRIQKQNPVASAVAVFFLLGVTLFGISRLPWFGYLRGETNTKNPYDLSALERMSPERRDKQIQDWVDEWRNLPDDEKEIRADQYLDAVVDYTAKRLGFSQSQKAETRGLIKSAALLAQDLRLEDRQLEDRREVIQDLRAQVLKEMDRVMSEEQRVKLQELIEERRRMEPPRYAPLRDGAPIRRRTPQE